MAELMASLPVVPLTAGMTIRFEAIDPDTGDAVAGVTVSEAVIYGVDLNADDETQAFGPFVYVPGAGTSAA